MQITAALGVLSMLGTSAVLAHGAARHREPDLNELELDHVLQPQMLNARAMQRVHHHHPYHHTTLYPKRQPHRRNLPRGILYGDDNVFAKGADLLSTLVGGEFTTLDQNSRAPSATKTSPTDRSTERKGGLPTSHEFTTMDKNSRASSTPTETSSQTRLAPTSTSSASRTSSDGDDEDSSTSSSPTESTMTTSDDGEGVGAAKTSTASSTRSTKSSSLRSSSTQSLSSSSSPTPSSSSSSSSSPASESGSSSSSSIPASKGSGNDNQNQENDDSGSGSSNQGGKPSSDDSGDNSSNDDSSSSREDPHGSPSMNNASSSSESDDGGTDHTGLIAGVCTAGGVVLLSILGFILYKLLRKRTQNQRKAEAAEPWPISYDAGPSPTSAPAPGSAPMAGDTSVDMSGIDDTVPHENPFEPQNEYPASESYGNVLPDTRTGNQQAVMVYDSAHHPSSLVPSKSIEYTPQNHMPVSIPQVDAQGGQGANTELAHQHFEVGQTYPEEAFLAYQDTPGRTSELYQDPYVSPFEGYYSKN